MKISPARFFYYGCLAFIGLVAIKSLGPEAFNNPKDAALWSGSYGRIIKITGRVCEEADVSERNRRLTVCAGEADRQILVTAALYPAYDYGDFLNLQGRLEKPGQFDSFDYARYLARYDIYALLYYPTISRLEGELSGSQRIYRWLLDGKQAIKSAIESALPEPDAGLADALLLGYRRTISPEDAQAFSRSGLSHLIAISGSHITLLSGLFLEVLFWLGFSRRPALAAVFIFLFLYPVLTGLSASALRASIMGGLVFMALYFGRLSGLKRGLAVAAAVMLAVNPLLLRSDAGFQLSFAAVWGIIYLYPLIQRWFNHRHRGNFSRLLSEAFSLTLACQLAVLPIMLINFQQLSLISFLANPAVAWVFPLLLPALILPLLPAGIIPAGAPLFFWPAYLLLETIFQVARWCASLPGAVIEVKNFSLAGSLLYYLVLVWLVYYLNRRYRNKRRVPRRAPYKKFRQEAEFS